MATNDSAPWHKSSYDRLLDETLPELLSARLPLAGYGIEPAGAHAVRAWLSVAGAKGEVRVEYDGLPMIDEDGLFEIEGRRVVVVSIASREELDAADIRCVGEQLYDFIEQRLAADPGGLCWDEGLLRSWAPLAEWFAEFFGSVGQALDEQNWLSRQTHLRRLIIPGRKKVVAPGQLGHVCPLETPEGNNIGRVLSIAVGAEIRDGRLVVIDDRPEAALSLSASMIPFLEHSDPNRLLMGANMMRQQETPATPEPALVQTGNEPDKPGFWTGRNLLTAFISWGGCTFEDSVIVSESAAAKLDFPHPLDVGDKLSNRHGAKGTVGRILPDDQMPHLPDGSAVELLYNVMGCHTRMNFGQIREAVMGRIARAEGQSAVVPAFQAPDEQEIRARLKAAGLAESGMEVLTDGADGKKLARPSTVGYVYWGKLQHLAAWKIHAGVSERLNLQGPREYFVLRDAGAFENILETFNTRAAGREDIDSIGDRVAAGPVAQAGPPSSRFEHLRRRLAAGGIVMDLAGEELRFAFQSPPGQAVTLARPVPHPWLPDRELAKVGGLDGLLGYYEDMGRYRAERGATGLKERYQALTEANEKLRRLAESNAPEKLKAKAYGQLCARTQEFFEALIRPGRLEMWERVCFSGRTVISPGPDLAFDQLGLAEDIAWTIFGPLLRRQLDGEEIEARTPKAAKVLDKLMAETWVLLNRAPSVLPTSILAFHAVRIPEPVIRLHPLACALLNADFDGDQAAVFLPITEAGQAEAGEKLTVAAHLRRNPRLYEWLVTPAGDVLHYLLPSQDILWGLAMLSLTPAGQKEIAELAGVHVEMPEGCLTRQALEAAMRMLLARDGAEAVLDALQRLMQRGFEAAKASGASISPFIGQTLRPRPPAPEDNPQAWERHREQIAEQLAGRTEFDDDDLGPQLLAVKSGSRGGIDHLARLVGPAGWTTDAEDKPFFVAGGLRDGYTPQELFARAATARRALGQVALSVAESGAELRAAGVTKAFTVLARAMRAEHPGVVFAAAAATGQTDPLRDADSRLFVGLAPPAAQP